MSDENKQALEGVSAQYARLSRGQRVLLLAGVFISMLFGALDQTVVTTALPRIVAELGGIELYAWIFTAYLLASTISMPMYGKLSDLYGRRPFFLAAVALFLIGSITAGLSQNMMHLILSRTVQGLGAGGLMALGQTLVGDIFPPAERGKWQGLVAALFGLVMLFGPMAGGWVTDHWGWRWIFYVNLPVGVLGLVLCWLTMPRYRANIERHVDVRGTLLLSAAMVPILLALSWGGTQYAWGSGTILGLLAFGGICLVTLLVAERGSPEPLIDLGLFGNDIYRASVLAVFLLNVGLYGAILFVPLFIQGVLGESATDSGAVLMPMLIAFVISSIVAGQVVSRTRRYRWLVVAMFAIGAAGIWLFSIMDVDSTKTTVARNMIITGLGLGGLTSVFVIIVQNALPEERLGEVTAGVQFYRSLGGTLGMAVLGSLLTNRFAAAIIERMPAELAGHVDLDDLQLLTAVGEGAAPATDGASAAAAMDPALIALVRTALADSLSQVFLVAAGILVAGLVSVLFVREIRLRKVKLGKGDAASDSEPESASDSDSDSATATDSDSASPDASASGGETK